jgi:hypothetical protein
MMEIDRQAQFGLTTNTLSSSGRFQKKITFFEKNVGNYCSGTVRNFLT